MNILVTGGGGFLGLAIVKLLLLRGDTVRSFSRQSYPTLKDLGVEQVCGDLADADSVEKAVKGCDIVYHVAAKAGVWGRYEDFYQPNVIGSENVIRACRKYSVVKLIYTSSPSVVFDGTDMEGVDESVPYPDHFHAWYPQTKARAEQLVLQANDSQLATVALRPHLIWGPEDNHLVPRIIARGRSGALHRIGHKPCLVDTVYIDNAAKAHILAEEHLSTDSAVAGQTYFISNNEPIPLWDMIDQILATADIDAVKKTISPQVAYAAGWLLEKIYSVFRLKGEPRMTRFVARELSTAHWFDLSAAQRDFGYKPEITIAEGLRRLHLWMQEKNL